MGILSTSENGIGITTVAAATLRPLFRSFLGLSLPDSSSIEMSRTWSPRLTRPGYVRSRERGPDLFDEEYISGTTVAGAQDHSPRGQENTLAGNVNLYEAGIIFTSRQGESPTTELENTSCENSG